MQVLIERLETVTEKIEARNEQFKKLISQTKILIASKPKKIVANGTLKIE